MSEDKFEEGFDPLDAFYEDKKGTLDKESSLRNIRLSTKRFRQFLESEEKAAEELEGKDIQKYIGFVKEEIDGVDSERTIDEDLSIISEMYKSYREAGYFEDNPVESARIRKLISLDTSGRDYPFIPHSEVAETLQDITHPRDRVMWLLFLKFGLRLGEVHNLDLRDINIDHHGINANKYYSEIEVRRELRERPDSLYISHAISKGEVHNGEERKSNNKRNVETILPIDDELKHALVRWLAARPPTYNNPAHPLLISGYSADKGMFTRIDRTTLERRLKNIADEQGWNSRTDKDDINTHYGRHYVSTRLRNRLGDVYTDYMRGDTGGQDSAKEAYTHEEWFGKMEGNWPDFQDRYLDSVYKFGLPTLEVTEIETDDLLYR